MSPLRKSGRHRGSRLKIAVSSVLAILIPSACVLGSRKDPVIVTCYTAPPPTKTPPIVLCYTMPPPTVTPTPTQVSPLDSPLPTPTSTLDARRNLLDRLIVEGRLPADIVHEIEA